MTFEIGFVKEQDLELDESKTWDLVVSENGKPRLNKARSSFRPMIREQIPSLITVFEYWRDYLEYLVLKRTEVKTGKVDYPAVKCSKRGNDVYAERVEKRLGFLKEVPNEEFWTNQDFDERRWFKRPVLHTKLLWVTLTFDPSVCALDVAWNGDRELRTDEKTGEVRVTKLKPNKKGIMTGGKPIWFHVKGCPCIRCQFNRSISLLRHHYGHIDTVTFLQAFPDPKGSAHGYTHIHAILQFKDHEFEVFPHMEKDRDGKLRLVFRLDKMPEFKDHLKWPAFVDVCGLRSMRAAYLYALKHVKNAAFGHNDEARIHNALGWLFRKRTFTVSGALVKDYGEFIKGLHNSKSGYQLDLFGGVVPRFVYELVGIFSLGELRKVKEIPDPPPWALVLDCSDHKKLVEERWHYAN